MNQEFDTIVKAKINAYVENFSTCNMYMCFFMTPAGELQLCGGAGENCSQIFTGRHWRPRFKRREPHPDPGSGLAVNEKVVHFYIEPQVLIAKTDIHLFWNKQRKLCYKTVYILSRINHSQSSHVVSGAFQIYVERPRGPGGRREGERWHHCQLG